MADRSPSTRRSSCGSGAAAIGAGSGIAPVIARAAREAGADPQLIAVELGYLDLAQKKLAEARQHFETARKGPDAGLAAQAREQLAAFPAEASRSSRWPPASSFSGTASTGCAPRRWTRF